jgi:hypothetical protein
VPQIPVNHTNHPIPCHRRLSLYLNQKITLTASTRLLYLTFTGSKEEKLMTEIGTPTHPLRVAIIGSGASGFYAGGCFAE